MSYASAALLYLERGFLPIPVKNKRPVPAGATGSNGVVDEGKVRAWTVDPEWMGQNVALRHTPYTMAIDVDQYGPKNGASQLAALEQRLGPLPATPSSTSRGQDADGRQHMFALKEPVELFGKPPMEGLQAKDIHIEIIQHHHRYSVVWPSVNPDADNAPYVWYDAEGEPMDGPPHVDDLEYLPEAWVEYLTAGEREHSHQTEQWDGDIPEVASDTEERKLRTIISRLEGLPDVWAPGAGWHDIVFAAACWLWRIARSNAYAITPDQAYQLLVEHTPTYPSWGVEKVTEQWVSAEGLTKGQFEEPPLENRPPLLADWRGLMETRAFPDINGASFFEVWGSQPEKRDPGALWHRRHIILIALLDAGLSEQEAATIAWHSAAARAVPFMFDGTVIEDPDSKCISEGDLWREVDQAIEELKEGTGQATPPAPAELRPDYNAGRDVDLLEVPERELLAGGSAEWFGSRYIDWARKTFPHLNEPYYRMNRWMILSVVFSPLGYMLKDGVNERPLHIYGCIAGPTTSGKTEAMWPVKQTIKAFYLGDNPDVGGDFTPESMENLLILRDGASTFYNVDEAHTKIAEWKKPTGPYSRMPGVITEAFDGQMVAAHRITRSEHNGKHADVRMTTHLMGTMEGFANEIEPDDWGSGFMARMVWAIGDRPKRSMESVKGRWGTKGQVRDDTERQLGRRMFDQWAAQFQQATARVARADGKPSEIVFDCDATRERFETFEWALGECARSRPRYAERLEPTFIRLAETALRCAALIALSEGRTEITMTDLLIVIEQAEEWVRNAFNMVEATNETIRTRRVNEIEKAILAAGGTMLMRDVHLTFPNRRHEVNDLIGELVEQGRVEKLKPEGIEFVKIKGSIAIPDTNV